MLAPDKESYMEGDLESLRAQLLEQETALTSLLELCEESPEDEELREVRPSLLNWTPQHVSFIGLESQFCSASKSMSSAPHTLIRETGHRSHLVCNVSMFGALSATQTSEFSNAQLPLFRGLMRTKSSRVSLLSKSHAGETHSPPLSTCSSVGPITCRNAKFACAFF